MNHRLVSGTLIGTGMLVALLGASTSARAQGSIVYHGPVNVFISGSGVYPSLYSIDMNTDGSEDFVFRAYDSFDIYSATGGRTVGVPVGGNDVGNWSIPLLEGFSIGVNLTEPLMWTSSYQPAFPPDYWVGAYLHGRNNSGSAGYWNPPLGTGLTAYVGAEFTLDDGVHFGWIQVSVTDIGNGGIIRNWAYNSIPGETILAGQVPEPGTVALLFAGSGFLWWRQQKLRARGQPNAWGCPDRNR